MRKQGSRLTILERYEKRTGWGEEGENQEMKEDYGLLAGQLCSVKERKKPIIWVLKKQKLTLISVFSILPQIDPSPDHVDATSNVSISTKESYASITSTTSTNQVTMIPRLDLWDTFLALPPTSLLNLNPFSTLSVRERFVNWKLTRPPHGYLHTIESCILPHLSCLAQPGGPQSPTSWDRTVDFLSTLSPGCLPSLECLPWLVPSVMYVWSVPLLSGSLRLNDFFSKSSPVTFLSMKITWQQHKDTNSEAKRIYARSRPSHFKYMSHLFSSQASKHNCLVPWFPKNVGNSEVIIQRLVGRLNRPIST